MTDPNSNATVIAICTIMSTLIAPVIGAFATKKWLTQNPDQKNPLKTRAVRKGSVSIWVYVLLIVCVAVNISLFLTEIISNYPLTGGAVTIAIIYGLGVALSYTNLLLLVVAHFMLILHDLNADSSEKSAT